ncbi:hypothetical protein C8R42DRAFT_645661 [Lentinula raphanica]|nr:hypothetical protein C8R42DRAFT_645661 [Lentinula raphanica]
MFFKDLLANILQWYLLQIPRTCLFIPLIQGLVSPIPLLMDLTRSHPAHKMHWSPMAKHFNPAQIVNFYIVYRFRVQSWNATYNWSLQIISFEDWYATIKAFNGKEGNFELWYWNFRLQEYSLNPNVFLGPLLIPPGFLVPVVETHPYHFLKHRLVQDKREIYTVAVYRGYLLITSYNP